MDLIQQQYEKKIQNYQQICEEFTKHINYILSKVGNIEPALQKLQSMLRKLQASQYSHCFISISSSLDTDITNFYNEMTSEDELFKILTRGKESIRCKCFQQLSKPFDNFKEDYEATQNRLKNNRISDLKKLLRHMQECGDDFPEIINTDLLNDFINS